MISNKEEIMYAIFVIVSLIVISFAIVAPWATITAFKSSGRWAGWTMTWGAPFAPRPTMTPAGHDPEILFFFAPLWGGYEFICTFAPLGLEEQETDDERAAATANEG